MISTLAGLLSEKNLPAALDLLQATPAEALRAAGLIKLWDLCHGAHFTAGELLLAPLIEAQYQGKPADYIRAVNSYVRAGQMSQAAAALGALLHFPAATKQAKPIVDFAIRIKNHELCQDVLNLLLADPDATVRERVVNTTYLAAVADAANMRHLAVRAMWLSLEGAGDDVESLERIARTLEGFGELSMALAARLRVAQARPDDVMKELEAVKIMAATEKSQAAQALAALLRRAVPTPAFWEGVSKAQQRLGQVTDAIASTQQALKYGGNVNELERRMAALYSIIGDTRGVMTTIKRMIVRPELQHGELRHLAGMALKEGEVPIAVSLAKRQYEVAGGAVEAVLFYAETLSATGRAPEAGTLLAKFCDGLPGGKPLARADLLKICDVAAKISRDDLRLRMLELGLVWFPGDVGLSDLKKQVAARVKFLGGGLFAAKG